MPSDFLQLAGKTVLVTGVANKKSVAWHIARLLTEADCRVIYSVRSEARREQVQKLAGPEATVLVCDVEHEAEIPRNMNFLLDHFFKTADPGRLYVNRMRYELPAEAEAEESGE